MNKLAKVVVEEPAKESLESLESLKEAAIDSDQLYVKKKKEDEIRMKLDQFAKELAQIKRQRDNH